MVDECEHGKCDGAVVEYNDDGGADGDDNKGGGGDPGGGGAPRLVADGDVPRRKAWSSFPDLCATTYQKRKASHLQVCRSQK